MPEWFQKRMCQASGQIRKRLRDKKKERQEREKSKAGNQGVSEGGKEAKKGRDENEGNAGKPFNHAASSTEPKAQTSEGRKGNKTNAKGKQQRSFDYNANILV